MDLLFAIKQLENGVGGAERVLATVCSNLAGLGHRVTVVTWDPPGAEPFYPIAPQVRVLCRGIGDAGKPATVGVTLRRINDLRRLALDERPDVAIGFCHSMFVPLAFALAGSGIPVVGSEHITPVHYRDRPLEFLLLRLAARGLKAITVMSEDIKRVYSVDVRSKMTVLPNPIMVPDGGTAEGRRCASTRTILNVGRLNPQKGQAILIRAFAQLAPDFPEWKLRIMGEGALRPALENLVEELGLRSRVDLPGVSSKIDDEYESATIMAVPSLYESMGLVSIEAMAHGLPVVGFADCPGTNEVITDGLDGILVSPGTDRAASLAATLRTLMSDTGLRAKLGEQGRSTVARLVSNDRCTERWVQLLQAVVAH